MYHDREASDPRDKVYALLGMSLDRARYPQLSPDYTISWGELLHRLVNLLTSDYVNVLTWPSEQISVLETKVAVIGEITGVAMDPASNDQRVDVSLRPYSSNEKTIRTRWLLKSYAKDLKLGDLICIMQGSSAFTIIRPYDYYCGVIAMAATPKAVDFDKTGIITYIAEFDWQSLLEPTQMFSHELPLVWDWRKSSQCHEMLMLGHGSRLRNLLTADLTWQLPDRLKDDRRMRNQICWLQKDLQEWRN